ncbi:MAG: hypothetical protein P1U89_22620 [Verrucomicrobiales bacterium]|nr:hypothetical protein [Verrucomicrobiales bacterium]
MSLKFSCPNCQARLSATPDLYHKQIDCPECSRALIVPKPEEIGAPPENLTVVKFLCPHCSQRLSALPPQFGQEMPCPHADCQKPVMVPRPEWKPIPTTLLKKGSIGANELVQKAQQMTRKPDKE